MMAVPPISDIFIFKRRQLYENIIFFLNGTTLLNLAVLVTLLLHYVMIEAETHFFSFSDSEFN